MLCEAIPQLFRSGIRPFSAVIWNRKGAVPMKLFSVLAATVVVTAGLGSAQTIRVGTFHKPSIVVAFYRSPLWADALKAKLAELEVAKQAHDTSKVQDLEAWGNTQQELAPRQLSGDAPLTNILEALSPELPEIARRAGAHLMASDILFADPTVQTVDVTDLLLDYLKADAHTLSIVRDLRKR